MSDKQTDAWVFESRLGGWYVCHERDQATFTGPGAESRAREYAAWKYPVVMPVVDESEALDPELVNR